MFLFYGGMIPTVFGNIRVPSTCGAMESRTVTMCFEAPDPSHNHDFRQDAIPARGHILIGPWSIVRRGVLDGTYGIVSDEASSILLG